MVLPIFIKASATRISISKEIREVNRLRLNYEKRMARKMESLFRTAGNRAASAFENGTSVNNANLSLQSEIAAVFRAQYSDVIEAFAKRVFDNRKFQPFQSLVERYYAANGAAKVVGVTETTRNIIRRSIEIAEREALGVDATAKLIKERTGGAIGRARAATIARTETHAASSWATDTATRELNLPNQKKRWVAVSDARTRSGHAAANGQEVGIDEDFLVPFMGQTIKMKYPHDGSGGAGNNINCRCLAVYFTDEDALFDDLDFGDVEEVAPAPEPDGPFVNLTAGPNLALPVIKGVRNEDFPVVSKQEALKELRKDLDFAAQQSNQARGTYFRDTLKSDFGEIKGADSLSKEAVTALTIINKELNYFADFLGIARVRGYKQINAGRTIANMGDGVMGFNASYFNKYAEDITKANDPALLKQRAKAKEKIDALQKKLDDNVVKIRERQAADKPWDDLDREQTKIFNELWDQKREFSRLSLPEVSDWTLGSEKRKPFTSEQYMTAGIDHMRATMYHEFGHQIHQTYKRIKLRNGYVTPSPGKFEGELKKRWFKVYPRKKKRNAEIYTRYAEQDAFEWFAENFSFWAMGQNEKVNPLFLEIIEEIKDDKST